MGKSLTHAMKTDPVFDPSDMSAGQLDRNLEKMDYEATQGTFWRGRTGHEIKPVDIGTKETGRTLAHCNQAADRHFICALVNTWRAGRLVVVPLNQEGMS